MLFKINNSLSLHYTSKLYRIFGFEICKKVNNKDFLFISDADMIPLSNSFFHDLRTSKLIIKSFGPRGYGYGRNKGRWAMCYMVANKYVWKDILQKDMSSSNIYITIENILTNEIRKGEKYFENFAFIDEVYMRDRIKEWKYFDKNVEYHIRNYHNTRIDRINWPLNIFNINKSRIIDIHLPKLSKNASEAIKIWKKKIIPLQIFLFNTVYYDDVYVKKLYNLKF